MTGEAGTAARLDEARVAELVARPRARLASFEVPKALRVVELEELPLGGSGKPLRRAARARWGG